MSGGTRWVPAMQRALALAQDAAAHGDVPIGAVLLGPDGQVLAEAGNERELTGDPTEGALLPFAAKVGLDAAAETAAAPPCSWAFIRALIRRPGMRALHISRTNRSEARLRMGRMPGTTGTVTPIVRSRST